MPPEAESPPAVVEGPSRRCETTRGRVRTSSPELFGTLPAPPFAFFAVFFEPPALFFFAEDFFADAFLRVVFFAVGLLSCGLLPRLRSGLLTGLPRGLLLRGLLACSHLVDLRWIEAGSGARA
jgi:hypothetical protein